MAKKLLIKAPVNSVKGAKMQIEAGAGELYVGLDFDYFNEFTFSGRFKKSNFTNKPTVIKFDELKKIVELAHKRNVLVEFVANTPCLSEINVNDARKKFLDYVRLGVEAGVDRIIVGDIGNIIYLRENGITTPITASTFLASINTHQIKFLEKLGVNKVVLPHPVKLDEIKAIVDCTDLEVEIFGHFGCSFIEGTCNLIHRSNENLEVGIPCRGCYKVGNDSKESAILDVNEDCTLCQLKEIIDSGVDSIKTIGRDLEPEFMANITAIYSLAIDLYLDGCSKDEVLKTIKEEFDFDPWKKQFCDDNRCKYSNTQYYI